MNDMMSPADFAAVSGRNNDGMFGGNGAWWIIILFLFAFMGNGWGNGGRNSGAADNYVLASDFATVQRMISDATNTLERKLDNTQNGICDLGYAQAQLAGLHRAAGRRGVQQTRGLRLPRGAGRELFPPPRQHGPVCEGQRLLLSRGRADPRHRRGRSAPGGQA